MPQTRSRHYRASQSAPSLRGVDSPPTLLEPETLANLVQVEGWDVSDRARWVQTHAGLLSQHVKWLELIGPPTAPSAIAANGDRYWIVGTDRSERTPVLATAERILALLEADTKRSRHRSRFGSPKREPSGLGVRHS